MIESSRLLVSVRSATEALAALAGGADVIDVKEPNRGSLGRADDFTIQEVVKAVDGRRPVSAALGEWADGETAIPAAELSFVKWGLARCGHSNTWRMEFERRLQTLRKPQCVLAAYGDWECANAPNPDEVLSLAAQLPGSVVLVDTHCKTASPSLGNKRPTLLDWLPLDWVGDFCARARDSRVRIALAGSLGIAEIQLLLTCRPDWFAVRGAVCGDGDRNESVDEDRVRRIADLLKHGD